MKMLEDLYTPEQEINSRISKLQNLLREKEIDSALIIEIADIFYFTGAISNGLLYIPSGDNPIYYVKKSFERAKTESSIKDKVKVRSIKHACSIILENLKSNSKIGIELDVIPAKLYLELKKIFKEHQLLDISNPIKDCRKVKSDFEIRQLKKASENCVNAFRKIPELIKEGMSELELSALIEYEIRKNGHQGFVRSRTFNMEFYFGPVSSGMSANYPISFDGPIGAIGLYPGIPHGASHKKIKSNEPIVIDFVSGFNGYIADMARVFAIDSVPKEILNAHRFILEILVPEIEKNIKPGVNGKDIFNLALSLAEESGYSEHFMGYGENKVKFIAHGVGIELDEVPILTKNDVILEKGMVFALEPKLFVENIGAAGFENTYLVTDNGFEKLTDFNEDIVII